MTWLIVIAIALVLAYVISKLPTEKVLSSWHHTFENFNFSPQEFYNLVKPAIEKRGIPQVSISYQDLTEGGFFSARRVYLRVRKDEHYFDICAAPYGTG